MTGVALPAKPATLSLDRPLPRGRHGISPGKIAEHQRRRLLGAVRECLAEGGYPALSVVNVSGRAGVSRATFYKLYHDKLDCVLDAQEADLAALEARLDLAAKRGPAAIVESVLVSAAADPVRARLALPCGPLFAEPRFAERAQKFEARLATQMRAASGIESDDLAAELASAAICSFVASTLARGEAESLRALSSKVADLTLSILQAGPAQPPTPNPRLRIDPDSDGRR